MTDAPDEEGIQLKLIIEADLLQTVVDALDALVQECRIEFLDELIRIWVADPANAAGCFIDLKPSENDQIKYYAVQPDGMEIGIQLAKLQDIIGYASGDDPIQIEHGGKYDWRFRITLPGVDTKIAGLDPESVRQQPDDPGLEDILPASYSITTGSLKDAVDLNDSFSDFTNIHAGEHQVSFVAEGDTDDIKYELEEGEGDLEFHDHTSESVRSRIDLAYLTDMVKVLTQFDQVTIHSGHDKPILIETDLFDYMIAPRIPKD